MTQKRDYLGVPAGSTSPSSDYVDVPEGFVPVADDSPDVPAGFVPVAASHIDVPEGFVPATTTPVATEPHEQLDTQVGGHLPTLDKALLTVPVGVHRGVGALGAFLGGTANLPNVAASRIADLVGFHGVPASNPVGDYFLDNAASNLATADQYANQGEKSFLRSVGEAAFAAPYELLKMQAQMAIPGAGPLATVGKFAGTEMAASAGRNESAGQTVKTGAETATIIGLLEAAGIPAKSIPSPILAKLTAVLGTGAGMLTGEELVEKANRVVAEMQGSEVPAERTWGEKIGSVLPWMIQTAIGGDPRNMEAKVNDVVRQASNARADVFDAQTPQIARGDALRAQLPGVIPGEAQGSAVAGQPQPDINAINAEAQVAAVNAAHEAALARDASNAAAAAAASTSGAKTPQERVAARAVYDTAVEAGLTHEQAVAAGGVPPEAPADSSPLPPASPVRVPIETRGQAILAVENAKDLYELNFAKNAWDQLPGSANTKAARRYDKAVQAKEAQLEQVKEEARPVQVQGEEQGAAAVPEGQEQVQGQEVRAEGQAPGAEAPADAAAGHAVAGPDADAGDAAGPGAVRVDAGRAVPGSARPAADVDPHRQPAIDAVNHILTEAAKNNKPDDTIFIPREVRVLDADGVAKMVPTDDIARAEGLVPVEGRLNQWVKAPAEPVAAPAPAEAVAPAPEPELQPQAQPEAPAQPLKPIPPARPPVARDNLPVTEPGTRRVRPLRGAPSRPGGLILPEAYHNEPVSAKVVETMFPRSKVTEVARGVYHAVYKGLEPFRVIEVSKIDPNPKGLEAAGLTMAQYQEAFSRGDKVIVGSHAPGDNVSETSLIHLASGMWDESTLRHEPFHAWVQLANSDSPNRLKVLRSAFAKQAKEQGIDVDEVIGDAFLQSDPRTGEARTWREGTEPRTRVGQLFQKMYLNLRRVAEGVFGAHWQNIMSDIESGRAFEEMGQRRAQAEQGDERYQVRGQAAEQKKRAPQRSQEELDREAHDSAIEAHGLTTEHHRAGYILPDGRMLDFSRTGKQPVEADGRTRHGGVQYTGRPENDNEAIRDYTRRGAIRVDSNHGYFEFGRAVTPEQEGVVRDILDSRRGKGYTEVDLHDQYGTPQYRTTGLYGDSDRPAKVLGLVNRFYAGEDIEPGTQFQVRDAAVAGATTPAQEKRAQKLWIEQGTKSPFFKKWFGDWEDPQAWSSQRPIGRAPVSMVVRPAKGGGVEPMPLYHGTANDFTTFDPGRQGTNSTIFGDETVNRAGFFFAEDPSQSIAYAEQHGEKGANLKQVYLNIKAPLDLTKEVDYDTLDDFKAEGINPGWIMRTSNDWELFDGDDGHNFVEAAKKIGYDGAIIEEENPSTHEMFKTWIAFDPEQIKSATGNRGTFDEGDADIRHQVKSAPTPIWYSKLERAIEEKMPRAATADQVRGIVKGAGVKPEEAEWSDLEGYLAAHPRADKAELLQHLKDNQVQMREVWKGLPPATISAAERQELFNLHTRERETKGQLSAAEWNRIEELETKAYAASGLPEGWKVQPFTPEFGDNKFEVLDTQGNQRGSGPTEDDAIKAARINAPESTQALTKFAPYQLPGGENYRELLLTMPQKQEPSAVAPGKMATVGVQYRSPHWDEPNVLAHVRMNDRVGPNGEKILHLEEIQSDWHQKGRESGYKTEKDTAQWTAKSYSDPNGERRWLVRDANGEPVASPLYRAGVSTEAEAIRAAAGVTNGLVPNAPFKKTWHELAIKRMLRYAAENGYDKLTWTTGEQQADRYDLAKQVDGIDYARKDDGNYTIGFRKNGAEIHAANDVAPERLADYVGKDAAQKILDNASRAPGTPEGAGYLTGVDLKVGGEGMRGFYDQILPSAANKLVKRWGGKVGETEIPIHEGFGRSFTGEDEARAALRNSQRIDGFGPRGWERITSEEQVHRFDEYRTAGINGQPVHSLDITPSMRESLGTEPQPMFQVRDRSARVTPEQEATSRLAADEAKSDKTIATDNPEGGPRFSVRSLSQLDKNGDREWEKQFRQAANAKGWSAEITGSAVAQLDAMADLFRANPDVLPNEGIKDKTGKPVSAWYDNADFGKTLDVNRICQRTREFYRTLNVVERKVGHLLDPDEMLSLGQYMRANDRIPYCIFCYVEAGRRAARRNEIRFARYTKADIKAEAKATGKNPAAFLTALQGVIPTRDALLDKLGMTKEQFEKIITSPARAAKLQKQDPTFAELFDHYEHYRLGAKATKLSENATYKDELLRLTDEQIRGFNDRAGVRMFSATDLDPTQLVDVYQALQHLSLQSLAAHAYTKEPQTVLTLGNTGLKTNISVAVNGRGPFTPDTVNGMDHGLASRLRESFPSAGTVFIAKNRPQLEWALREPWIDFIIPHHAAGWEGGKYKDFDLEELKKGQHEEWIDKAAHRGKSPVDTFGSQLWYTSHLKRADNNEAEALRSYLAFCEENGIEPKFPQYLDNPGYVKLLKDYARTDSPQLPIDASKIDYANGQRWVKDFVGKGGLLEISTPSIDVVNSFVKDYKAGKLPPAPDMEKRLAALPQPNRDTPESVGIEKLPEGQMPSYTGAADVASRPETTDTAEMKPSGIPALHRGAPAGRENGAWYTPDRKAAQEYANLREDGKVSTLPPTSGKVADASDIMRAATAVGAAKDQALYWLLSPEVSEDAPKVLAELRRRGFDWAHLPKGEDFTESGRGIESYRRLNEDAAPQFQVQDRARKYVGIPGAPSTPPRVLHDEVPGVEDAIDARGGRTSGRPGGLVSDESKFPINLDRIDSPQETKRLLARIADAMPESIKRARGYESFEDMRKDAPELTERDFKRLRAAGMLTPGIVIAGRDLRQTALADLQAKAGTLKDAYGTLKQEEAEYNYHEQLMKTVGIINETVAMGAEAGRALAAHREMAKARDPRILAFRILKNKGVDDPEILGKIVATPAGNQAELLRIVQAAIRPTWRQKVAELAYSGMMSGIPTHLRNMTSNTIANALKYPEQALAGAIDAVRARATGTERERYVGEALKSISALDSGTLVQALRAARSTWNEEGDPDWGKIEAGVMPALEGKVGKFMRGPLRAAGAEDAFFSTLAMVQGMHAGAYRHAVNEGVKGADNIASRMEYILANAEEFPDVLAEGERNRRYWTFQNDLGPGGKKFLSFMQHAPILRLFVAPFLKTPINITKFAVERSPIGLADAAIRMAQGKLTGGEASDRLARGSIGTAVLGSLVYAAAQGYITGMGPSDFRQASNKRDTGWQPYSVKIGDTYVSYRGMEPLSTWLMAAANYVEAAHQKDQDTVISEFMRATRDTIIDKSYLQGFENLAMAMSDAQRYGKQWIKGIAGMPVPAIVARAAAATDDSVRRDEPNSSFPEKILRGVGSRIPGVSQHYPEVKSATGKPVTRDGSPLMRFLSPTIITHEEQGREVEREFDRLGWVPSAPPRELTNPRTKKPIQLSENEYERYELAYKEAAQQVRTIIGTESYQRLPEGKGYPGLTKEERLRKVYDQARARARASILRDRLAAGER